eukprot:130526_1
MADKNKKIVFKSTRIVTFEPIKRETCSGRKYKYLGSEIKQEEFPQEQYEKQRKQRRKSSITNDSNDLNDSDECLSFTNIVKQIREDNENTWILWNRLEELLANIHDNEYQCINPQSKWDKLLLNGGESIKLFLLKLGFTEINKDSFVLKVVNEKRLKYAKIGLQNRTNAFCECIKSSLMLREQLEE